jgi:adenylate cyclase
VVEQDFKRKLTAILSADVKGYSLLMRDNEEETVRAITAYREVIGSIVRKHRGEVVDSPGDNIMAEFASVVDAVRSAVEIQKELKVRNAELAENRRMEFRIGINLGDVISDGERIYGDGVNVAARMESLAEAGGICVSGSAYDQIENKLAFGCEYLGEQTVKNISTPIRVYRLTGDESGPECTVKTPVWKPSSRLIYAAVIGLLIISIGGFIAYSVIRRPTAGPLGIASVEQMAYPLPDKPSIAVLPFENMTGDPKQEFFTDGFTEQIITSLSKISSLFVISRNSMFSYKGKPVKVQQVSKELGVRYVLEGSIQKSGDRVRIDVQLIDAISGRHVWAESYDRDLKDIFALQDEVILKIASALQVNLTSGEQARLWAEGTKSLEAYLKLMQSREYRLKGNRASYALAQRMAEEAIALDPKYAKAYALLGYIYFWKMLYGSTRHEDDIQKATELTQKALALNDSLADAHSNLGLLYWYSGRYDAGITEAERAVELDPNSGHASFVLGFLLRMAGKPKEAIPVIQKALRLEPMAPDLYNRQLALDYFQAGDCKEAIATCEKGLKRQRDNLVSRVTSAAVYGACGREAEARKEATEVLRINPKFTVESFMRKTPYKNPSDRERVSQGLRKAGLK